MTCTVKGKDSSTQAGSHIKAVLCTAYCCKAGTRASYCTYLQMHIPHCRSQLPNDRPLHNCTHLAERFVNCSISQSEIICSCRSLTSGMSSKVPQSPVQYSDAPPAPTQYSQVLYSDRSYTFRTMGLPIIVSLRRAATKGCATTNGWSSGIPLNFHAGLSLSVNCFAFGYLHYIIINDGNKASDQTTPKSELLRPKTSSLEMDIRLSLTEANAT